MTFGQSETFTWHQRTFLRAVVPHGDNRGKAFTIAQNLGAGLHDFVTVNMDMTAHYRPGENVLRRPAAVGGKSYTLLGRHEIMVPLLAQAVVDTLGEA